MGGLKPAKVIYGPRRGNERMVRLHAGAKGRGRVLISIREWPGSPQSRQKTEDLLEQAAAREGYTIIEEQGRL